MSSSRHDAAVDHLAAQLTALAAARPGLAVLTRAFWRPLADFPNVGYVFDILVVADGRRLNRPGEVSRPPAVVSGDRVEYGPDLRPGAVVDVVAPGEDYEAELYDKPDALIMAHVPEYLVVDPTSQVLRPPMAGLRQRLDDGYRMVRSCGDGVFFSRAGFRVAVREGELAVDPCGPADAEEKLFADRKALARAAHPAAADALRRRIAAREERLTEWWARRGRRGLDRGDE